MKVVSHPFDGRQMSRTSVAVGHSKIFLCRKSAVVTLSVLILATVYLISFSTSRTQLLWNIPEDVVQASTVTSLLPLAVTRMDTQGFRSAEQWYLDLLADEERTCHHTSTLFHYFLPHQQCRKPRRIGRCNDGAKWICLDMFDGRTTHRAMEQSKRENKDKKCVVYSFGSSDDSCFESAMAERFDCEIHIFDPTSSELHDERWTYHSYGLGGADSAVTSYWSWRTQSRAECEGCSMKSLDQIMKELGHSAIDVLKVDIDGAEWRSFEHAYDTLKTLPADQIQVELTGLDISSVGDSLAGGLSGVYAWWSRILRDGFKVFYLESNAGTCNGRDQTRAASIEYALWRPKSKTIWAQ